MSINRRNFLYTFGALATMPLSKSTAKVSKPQINDIENVQKFCFGSCNRHKLDQPLWLSILNESPDFFMWMGDAVYCDTEDIDVMRSIYKQQKEHHTYKTIHQNIPIIGVWDDHDYGQNNAGKENPIKEQARQNYLEFIDEPLLSNRWYREGIYSSHEVGNIGQKVKIILLDLRFNKTKERLLGEDQWRWLESEFATSNAEINIVVSSIPFVAPKLMRVEHWKRYPEEYKQLLELIDRYNPKGLFFMTGDQHLAGAFSAKTPAGYPLYEFMSSGLTHHAKKILKTYLNRKYGKGNYFIDQNYGVFSIDWSSSSPLVKIELKGLNSKNRIERSFQIINDRPAWI